MKSLLKNNWQSLVLGLLSFLTHFLFLNYPSQIVFDEMYYSGFVKDYFTRQFYFCIHPPTGKLMIYFFSRIFGLKDLSIPNAIGQVFNAGDALILRFLPAFFGSIFILLIYYLILKIGLSKKAAFLGAVLVLCDNAILTQSKLVLLDIFLLFFGFLSFYFLLSFKDALQGSKKAYCFLALAAVSAGLSFSVKWTGLSFGGLVGLFFVFDVFKNFNARRVALNLLIIVVLPFLIYYSIFVVHFLILTKPGSGDVVMSSAFQNMQNSVSPSSNPTMWQKFVELNQKMSFYNSTTTSFHAFGSKWFQWPLGKRPIWYWSKSSAGKVSNIYLVGNFVVWWAVFLGVAFSFIFLPYEFFRKKLPPIFYLLTFGYFINLLPFVFITRVAFLYHYFPSLIFGILILAVLYDTFLKNTKHIEIYYWSFIGLVSLCFLLISPLTYGMPLPLSISHYYSSFVGFFL